MKKKGIILMLLAALGLGVSGCEKKSEKAEEVKAVNIAQQVKAEDKQTSHEGETVIANEADKEQFKNGTIDFSLKLFQENLGEEQENVMISPVSVLNALAMTANGADHETLRQMLAVLTGETQGNVNIDVFNQTIKEFSEGLTDSENASLKQANSIWFKDDEESFAVEPDFLEKNEYYFGADIFKAPFDESTLQDINNWVKDKTEGKIEEILDKIPNDKKEAVMYLINAISFDAQWRETYSEHQVREGEFTSSSGEIEKVQMMHSEEGNYLEDENASGFIKYYREGYYFMAMLPKEGVSAEDYVNSLDAQGYQELLENKRKAVVMAAIPKFESEYDVELSELLKGMGMTDAFDMQKADFSLLGSSPQGNIAINRVLHKTFIQLDETGTKAGAATVVEMVSETAVMPPEEMYEVYLDRPFMYAIVDGKTNIPMFIGIVNHVE